MGTVNKIYLLDTNTISELSKRFPDPKVYSQFEAKYNFCNISAQTCFELEKGLELMPEGRKKEELRLFLFDYVREYFPIISYDSFAASINAKIYASLSKHGKIPPILDSQIASIAIANNLILVTRNTKDFEAIQEEFNLNIENWFE